MNCPRCSGTVLAERERDGILVDVCPTCRGVWLDRGELEKFIARATREFDDDYARHQASPPRIPGRDYDDDYARHQASPQRVPGRDYDDDARYPDGRHPKRKRGWLDALGDIFD
jgi:uncharacterized protein